MSDYWVELNYTEDHSKEESQIARERCNRSAGLVPSLEEQQQQQQQQLNNNNNNKQIKKCKDSEDG